MPILKNAKKALRSSKRKATVNQVAKSRNKTMIDRFNANPTVESLSTAFSAIDKAVRRHLFHKNKAARLKSQLSRKVATDKTETKKVATKKVAAK